MTVLKFFFSLITDSKFSAIFFTGMMTFVTSCKSLRKRVYSKMNESVPVGGTTVLLE